MITSRKCLMEFIILERKNYGYEKVSRRIIGGFLQSSQYMRWKYQFYLRHSEYWYNNGSVFSYIMRFYWRRKKNKLGMMLGIDIKENCVDKGLMIFHEGFIMINGNAHIGENCRMVGNICIGNQQRGKGAPNIGDNVFIGVGASIIGNISIPNGVQIGAGAVVTKSCKENDILVGIPATAKCKKANA